MIVVVGGQCRNVGKTTVICEVIRALSDLGWTAVKISRHSHREHRVQSPKNDTERYLAAGARDVRLLRGPTAAETLEYLNPLLNGSGAVIIESNSILEVVKPDYYVLVVDSNQDDVKDSAQKFVGRADAVVSCFGTGQPAFSAARPFVSVSEMLRMLGERIVELNRQTA